MCNPPIHCSKFETRLCGACGRVGEWLWRAVRYKTHYGIILCTYVFEWLTALSQLYGNKCLHTATMVRAALRQQPRPQIHSYIQSYWFGHRSHLITDRPIAVPDGQRSCYDQTEWNIDLNKTLAENEKEKKHVFMTETWRPTVQLLRLNSTPSTTCSLVRCKPIKKASRIDDPVL